MNRLFVAGLTLGLISYSVIANASNFSGTGTITSNYVWRGITQSNNDPAVQAGLNYNFNNGLYVGLWGSSIDFNNNGDGHIEIDYTAGFTHNLTDKLSFNTGLTRYAYPHAGHFDYNELFANLTYDIFTAGVAYSNDVFHQDTNGTYVSADINYDIPTKFIFNLNGFTAQAHAGRYFLGHAAGDSYNDYLLGIGKKIKSTKWQLAWTSTNRAFANDKTDRQHVIANIIMSFE